MLDRHSLYKVPDQLVLLCSVWVKSKKQSYLDICQVIEQDEFLSLYLKNTYREHWQKGGIMTLVKSLGWEGLRDIVAEAYLHQFVYKKFPPKIVPELVSDNIDFARRFDFLSASGNQRTFLLGHLLNQTNLDLEEQGLSVLIPLEVDAILSKQKSKTHQPDWLIIATWGLVELLGAEQSEKILTESKGEWESLPRDLTENQIERFLAHMLSYAYAINDEAFFITETV